MDAIRWEDSYSVAVPWLDSQHQSLFSLYATLVTENAGGRRKAVAGALEAMSRYFSAHFSDEEKYLAEIGYPGLSEHNRQHDLFVSRTMDFVDRFTHEDILVGDEIVTFLGQWLLNHICTEDKKYAQWIGGGMGAA